MELINYNRTRAGVVLTLLMLCLRSIASADFIPPGEVEIKTAAYTPAKHDYRRGQYRYAVEWQGIPVGSAFVYVSDQNGRTNVVCTAKSNSTIDIFYKLRHRSESEFEWNPFHALRFVSDQTANSKWRRREIDFLPGGRVKAIALKEDSEEEGRADFVSHNMMLDPVSAAFLARTIPIDLNSEVSFDVFNGRHRYLIKFVVEERETIKLSGTEFDTFKVRPTVQKLTDSEGEKRFRSAYIWVSADDSREILKLKSEVLIGSVSAELKEFNPEVERPNVVRARLGNP